MNMIKFYNTAIRKKEEFKPIEEGKVGIYSCGPTAYWSPHVGNMYAYLFNDVLVRTLRYLGHEVKQVMNITDVGELSGSGEDKMEEGAKREGLSVWEVAKKYEKEFFESSEMLNITTPNVVCRATEYIKEQIELIKIIEANGYAYLIDDGLYFDTSKFSDYAKFANLKLDELIDTDRDEISKQKRNRSDFALWKFSYPMGRSFDSAQDDVAKRRQMEWESPWGKGFPGWHIECTAMSTKHLGNVFDIHTGGIDHIPVHHTNEIAQGYGAFGRQTANFWIHNGWVMGKGGKKMAKSSGDIVTMPELKKMGIEPLVYRYLFLTTHYRNGVEFSVDSLKMMIKPYEKLKSLVVSFGEGGAINEDYKKQFIEKIADDLAMPEAMALLWQLIKDEKIKDEDKKATILDFDKVLGLDLDKETKEEVVPKEVMKLVEERKIARKNKDFGESDRLRREIEKMGYAVEDEKDDCKIRKIVVS